MKLCTMVDLLKILWHVQKECVNLLKQKKKSDSKNESDTDSDDGKQLRNFVAFTTLKSVLRQNLQGDMRQRLRLCQGLHVEVMMMLEVIDDDDGSLDLAGNYEKLYENWLKLIEANSELNMEKVNLEAQVGKALKYASEKEEEAQHAGAQLAETQKGLRMLNNGKKQLHHLLSTEKNARFNLVLDFKGGHPKLKASNGKTEVKTVSTKVSDLITKSKRKFRLVCHHCGVVGHIRPRCFKLLRENNQIEQAYGRGVMVQYVILVEFKDMFNVTVSSLSKEVIMEDYCSGIYGLGDFIAM
ncbi:hypothetical protein F2Q69_00036007 [Brassica cretica]|uniref:CCHC-type domain-containing protein n=1 Tax=Brassica cretica TaxID=69181 RepID=A0A8S9SER2_BRACR|nr:hypothetical protein F2Q69_00036007 [Brassica cretica]